MTTEEPVKTLIVALQRPSSKREVKKNKTQREERTKDFSPLLEVSWLHIMTAVVEEVPGDFITLTERAEADTTRILSPLSPPPLWTALPS